jgi:hypothetical protein
MPITISSYLPHTNKQGILHPGCIPFDTTFEIEMERIKNGYYKELIAKCRAISDHKERNEFKAKYLPSLTISAICKDWRKEANVVQHTGLITFDIDSDHNPGVTDWPKLRDEIFKSEKVICSFLSASGNGLAFCLKIIPSQHKDVFHSIEQEFKNLLNIVVDKSGKDIVRLRFISYDEGLKIKDNINAVPITLPSEEYLKRKKSGGKMSILYSSKVDSYQTFIHAVNFATSKLEFADGTKHWHLVNMAGYCNSVGMNEDFCIKMAINYYYDKSNVSNNDIEKPIKNVYRSYRSQFATKQIPKPPYTFKELKWLLSNISKSLLKQYIYQFGKDTYIGERPHSIMVSSKLLAFFMWMVAPEYTWTTKQADELFTNQECKDAVPDGAYLDSCNGSRVWCCKKFNYPINWK